MRNVTATTATPGGKDPLAEKVVELVRGLVDGNGASRDDVLVNRLERKDRQVSVLLDIMIGWASANEKVAGRLAQQGSRLCPDNDSIVASMRRECGTAASDPAVAAALAEVLRKAPADEFRTRQDGFKVRDLALRFHRHEACPACGGEGEHTCDNRFCLYGEVTCTRCRGDRRETCRSCSGSGNVVVQISVRNYDGSHSYQNGYRTCNGCHGAGRAGLCLGCSGQGTVLCPNCRGTQRVACSPCGATGWFTHRHWTWLTGTVRRSWIFEKDAPAGFKESLKGIGIVDLPGTHAETMSAAVSASAGKCQVRLECSVPHVRAEMRCRGVAIGIDAIGRTGSIPRMPTFLDDLLGEVWLAVAAPRASGETVIKAAQSARLPRGILEQVCRGGKFDPQQVVRQFSRAVSETVVTAIHTAIGRSYDRLGQVDIRRCWLRGIPVIAAVAVVSALYDKTGWLPAGVVPITDWGAVLAPVLVVWLSAGALGQRGVRSLVGGRVARRPRQGIWPWGATVLALGLHAAVLASPVDARGLGMPMARAPVPRHAPGIVDGMHHALLGRAPQGRGQAMPAVTATSLPSFARTTESLAPSSLPHLTVRAEPPESGMRGIPAVWRLEFNLAQLGFYHGPPDGVPGSLAMRLAVSELLAAIPEYKARHIQDPVDVTVRKVLRDEIRLSLPADSTVASPLSNLARANLSRDDLSRLQAAVERAGREPGNEQLWSSADRKRGGRVLMASAEPGSGNGMCGRFYMEVEVDGAVDQAGPERTCSAGGGWMPAR